MEFKHKWPDLFILDKELPTLDGLAISKFLRLQESTKTIPIIMISAHHVGNRAKRIGIDEFIKKPFQLNHLLEVIRRYTQTEHEEIHA